MISSVLTLGLIFLVYYISHSIVITIVGGIGIILIVKNLSPYITLLESKLFPMPTIKKMRELNMKEEPGRGVRIFVASQFTDFDPKNPKSVELYDKIVSEAVEKLKETKPLFDLRYSTVCEQALPMQYSFSVCGEKKSGMRRCYGAWLKEIKAKDFGVWKENSELFLYDGLFDDPVTDELRSSLVLFLFDSRLPKTIKKPAEGKDSTANE